MSTAKDLIEEHFGSGIEFDELSEQQLKELVAQWLLDGAPGNPFGAEDFFFDGLVGNKELVKPVIDAMSGNASEFDLMGCIAKGIADECKEVVEEYWDQIVFDIQMEAA